MKTEVMVIVLALLCIGSLAAAFVLWSKLDEQKQKTAEERDRRWDEISLKLTAEKALEDQTAIAWQYSELAIKANLLYHEERIKNDALQDKLSALLCPHNDHVWKDGVCVKCGRVQDG